MNKLELYVENLKLDEDEEGDISESSNFRAIILPSWIKSLKKAFVLSGQNHTDLIEPHKFNPLALEQSISLLNEIMTYVEKRSGRNLYEILWTNFIIINIYSFGAKWHFIMGNFSDVEGNYNSSLGLARHQYKLIIKSHNQNSVNVLGIEKYPQILRDEFMYVLYRSNFLLVDDFTNYGAFFARRDLLDKGLNYLNEAEKMYYMTCSHDVGETTYSDYPDSPIITSLSFLTPKKKIQTIIDILTFKGMVYRKRKEDERAFISLGISLKKSLELNYTQWIPWVANALTQAEWGLSTFKCIEISHSILLSATTVILALPLHMRLMGIYQKVYADLGRIWVELGCEMLKKSSNIILNQEAEKEYEYKKGLTFNEYEKMSFGFPEDQEFFDGSELINKVKLPMFNYDQYQHDDIFKMPSQLAKNFEEARQIFLPLQKWFRLSTEYYSLNSPDPSSYIVLTYNYANSFKYLLAFETDLTRQEKLYKRRVKIFKELQKEFNKSTPVIVICNTYKSIAESHMDIYKFKVKQLLEKFQSNEEHSKSTYYEKTFKTLQNSVEAQKKILDFLKINIYDTKNVCLRNFNSKLIISSILSLALLQSKFFYVYPLNEKAVEISIDAKNYSMFAIKYLDKHPEEKEKFLEKYEEVAKIPMLVDEQLELIKCKNMKEIEMMVDVGISYLLK